MDMYVIRVPEISMATVIDKPCIQLPLATVVFLSKHDPQSPSPLISPLCALATVVTEDGCHGACVRLGASNPHDMEIH